MKIATFNINNITRRLPNLLVWLSRAKPDIVALQELKSTDGEFSRPPGGPVSAIADAFTTFDVADLHDASLQIDHGQHRVVGLRRRIDAVEGSTGPYHVELELASQEYAGRVRKRRRYA